MFEYNLQLFFNIFFVVQYIFNFFFNLDWGTVPMNFELEFWVMGFITTIVPRASTEDAEPMWYFRDEDTRGNCWEHPKLSQKRTCLDVEGARTVVNKCQKPWRLYQKFIIERFSRVNETVLDLCAGTGSAAIACMISNRDVVSVDFTNFQITHYKSRLIEFIGLLDEDDAHDDDGRLKTEGKEFGFSGV